MTGRQLLVWMFAALGVVAITAGSAPGNPRAASTLPRTIPLSALQKMLRDHPGSAGWILGHYIAPMDHTKNPAPLCHPEIEQQRTRRIDMYPEADALFRQGAYRASARAFYQTFFCQFAPIDEGLDPRVSDGGELAPFGAALSLAADGRYREAVRALRGIVRSLPPFGEARYVMGCYEWAAGDHHAARLDWRRTVEEPAFMLPDEDASSAASAAKRMLNWSKGR